LTIHCPSLYLKTMTGSTDLKYPVLSLQNAIEVAQAVSDAGGANTDVQNPVIAHALGSSHTSGGFSQRLSSARAYGLIAGGRSGYRLTDAGKRYFFPSNESEKRQASLGFLSTPAIFSEIIKRFDGNKIPNTEMLANVLMREMRIPESWKERVARFFLKAAHDAGIIDGQGVLRYSATRHTMETDTSSVSKATPSRTREFPISTENPSDREETGGIDVLVFSVGDQTVRMETPKGGLSRPLWEKLNRFVKALEPEIRSFSGFNVEGSAK
jgi:hypothetical protein